jgi:hypothetical protein
VLQANVDHTCPSRACLPVANAPRTLCTAPSPITLTPFGFLHRLAAQQALPLSEWDPEDPTCASAQIRHVFVAKLSVCLPVIITLPPPCVPHRLAAQQALPLSEWDPEDPTCASRKAPLPPPPFIQGRDQGGPITPASLIPALGGGGGIPALGGHSGPGGRGGPGPRGAGTGPQGGGGGYGGPGGGGGYGGPDGGYAGPGGGFGGPGGGAGDSNKAQVMAAVADVLRKKVAAVPHAFGECDV